MKLPRDLSAAELEKALRRAFDYQFVRQVGSHRRLTTQTGGEHHLTIPNHDPLRPGTLRTILASPWSRFYSDSTSHDRPASKRIGFPVETDHAVNSPLFRHRAVACTGGGGRIDCRKML